MLPLTAHRGKVNSLRAVQCEMLDAVADRDRKETGGRRWRESGLRHCDQCPSFYLSPPTVRQPCRRLLRGVGIQHLQRRRVGDAAPVVTHALQTGGGKELKHAAARTALKQCKSRKQRAIARE